MRDFRNELSPIQNATHIDRISEKEDWDFNT